MDNYRLHFLLLYFFAPLHLFCQEDVNIDSLKAVLSEDLSPQKELTTKVNIAKYYIFHEIDSAEIYIDEVLSYPNLEIELPTGYYLHFLVKSWVHHGRGELEDAKSYLYKAYKLPKVNDKKAKIELGINLGALYEQTKDPRAMEFVDSLILTLDTLDSRSDRIGWILCQQYKAKIYGDQDDYYKGIETAILAGQLSFLNDFPKYKLGIINILSDYLNKIGDFKASEKYLLQALNNKSWYPYEIKILLPQLAGLYFERGYYSKAEMTLDKMLDYGQLSETEGHDYHKLKTKMLIHREAFPLAMNHLSLMKKYASSMQDKELYIYDLLLESEVRQGLEQVVQSNQLLTLAKQELKKNPALKTVNLNAYFSRVRLTHNLKKENESLLSEFNDYIKLKEEADQLVSDKVLKELEIEYETEQKQDSIALLQANQIIDNRKIEQQQIINYFLLGILFAVIAILWLIYNQFSLKKKQNLAIQEKNNMLSTQKDEIEILNEEINHRVKNSLQLVFSLMQLQHRRLENDEAKSALKENENRIKAMAMIHERLHNQKGTARISLADYLQELINHLQEFYKDDFQQISIHSDMEDVVIEADSAIRIGLILNELVTNGFKHAFPEGFDPTINIQLRRVVNDAIQLTYSDTGQGFPDNHDTNKLESLGIKLIKIITQQLDGKYDIINKNGVTFRFDFDLNKLAKN